ncbi:hypothetical protein [Phenylobacterium sp.]|uniref:hypothetical protein n=1 Tax=Phenylobacterium sp. TaxID=1871053 RepID=UPI002EDB9A66
MLLVLFTTVVGVLGFWDIYAGPRADPQPHHYLHVGTIFGWMGLLLAQISLLVRGEWASHRRLGLAVLFAGPLLAASAALLTVHSARSALASGEEDFLIVQNVLGTLWLALILFMAFALKKRRKLHGALLSSTLILFLGPALFFTLIAFAPPFRIEGPETFYRFETAVRTGLGIILLIVLLLFAKDRRNNWPYLFAAASYLLGEVSKAMLVRLDLIDSLTRAVATPSELAAFIIALAIMLALLVCTVLPATPRMGLREVASREARVDAGGPPNNRTA